MIRISALNAESSFEEDASCSRGLGAQRAATKEAQEAEAFQIYSNGLALQQNGEVREAEEVFRSLLEKPFVKEAVPPEEDGDPGPLQPCQMLRYSLHKNLASIATQRGDENEAMEQYLEAVVIDSTDVSVWYRVGKLALKLCHFQLARHAFEQGLLCNPRHTLCLDNVIPVLYALNNYEVCLEYVAQALERDPGYVKALAFMRQMFKEQPSLHKDNIERLSQCDPSIYSIELDKSEIDEIMAWRRPGDKPLSEAMMYIEEALVWRGQKREKCKPPERPVLKLTKAMTSKTWECLGQSLVALYDYIEKAPSHIRLSCLVDLQSPPEEVSEPEPPKVKDKDVAMETEEAAAPKQPPEGASEEAAGNSQQPPAEDSKTGMPEEEDSVPISNKRKRSIFDDPAGKRRSARVKSTSAVHKQREKEKNVDYQEVLRDLLPEKLCQVTKDDDVEMMQEDPAPVKENTEVKDSQTEAKAAAENSEENVEDLANQEKLVEDFMTRCVRNNGLLDVLNRYLLEVVQSEGVKWTPGLVTVFLQAYTRFRDHMMFPDFLCKDAPDSRIKAMAQLCLLHSELLLDKYTVIRHKDAPKKLSSQPPDKKETELSSAWFKDDLFYVLGVAGCKEILEEDWNQFGIRAYWLRARYMMLQGQLDGAFEAFQVTRSFLCVLGEREEDVNIKLPHCTMDNNISAGTIEAQLEQVNRCQSFEALQRLSNKGDYEAVVELLIQNFHRNKESNKYMDADDNAERQGQLLLLVDSLVELKDYKRGIFWGETAFDEALLKFQDSINEGVSEDWEATMLQLMKSIKRCADKEPGALVSLPSQAMVRLTSNLLKVIEIATDVQEMSPEMNINTVLPWILLYKLVALTESKDGTNPKKSQQSSDEDSDDEDEHWLPQSMRLLGIAHECLGRHSWCVTLDGELLHFIVNEVNMTLKKDYDDICYYKDELEQMIEQCFYCLYCYPSKRRPKHLQDHNVPQVSFTWERCAHLFDYYKPQTRPEFDSLKSISITVDQESLLQRIITLIPTKNMPILDEDAVLQYIDGRSDKAPELSQECEDKIKEIPVVQEIYYLLADYHFKNKDENKAVEFYLNDLCVMPTRFDSWAGMALARASRLETKLKPYELKPDGSTDTSPSVWKQGKATLQCFQRALELDGKSCKLWIEYGSLAYQLHSHASRRIKQPSLHNMNAEQIKKTRSYKLEMLRTADHCYRRACDTHQEYVDEEEWLYHYMLGKVAEKLQRPPDDYLDQYRKAAIHLHDDMAKYPKKITYVIAPPHLAIEALEVYYRLHVSVFKLLMRQPQDAPYDVILAYLKEAAEGPFATGGERKSREVDYASKMLASSAGLAKEKEVDHTYFRQQSADASDSSVEITAVTSNRVTVTNQRTGVAVVGSLSDSADSTPYSPTRGHGTVGSSTQLTVSSSGGVTTKHTGITDKTDAGSSSSAAKTTGEQPASQETAPKDSAVEAMEVTESDKGSVADIGKSSGDKVTSDVESIMNDLVTAAEKSVKETPKADLSSCESDKNRSEKSDALKKEVDTAVQQTEPTGGISKEEISSQQDPQDSSLSKKDDEVATSGGGSSQKTDDMEAMDMGEDSKDLCSTSTGNAASEHKKETGAHGKAESQSKSADPLDQSVSEATDESKSSIKFAGPEHGSPDTPAVLPGTPAGALDSRKDLGDIGETRSPIIDILKELDCMNALASSSESTPAGRQPGEDAGKSKPVDDEPTVKEGSSKEEVGNEAMASTSAEPTPGPSFRAPGSPKRPLMERKPSTSSTCSGLDEAPSRDDPVARAMKEAAVCSSSEDENPTATAQNVIAELMQLSEAAASVNTKTEPGLSDLDFGISGSSQDSEPKAEPDSAGQNENSGDISTAALELLTSQLLELNKESMDASTSECDQKMWAKDLFGQPDDAFPSTSDKADGDAPGMVSSSGGVMDVDDGSQKVKEEVTSSSEVQPEAQPESSSVQGKQEDSSLHAISSSDMETEVADSNLASSGAKTEDTVKEQPASSEAVTSSEPVGSSDPPVGGSLDPAGSEDGTSKPHAPPQSVSSVTTGQPGTSSKGDQGNNQLTGSSSRPQGPEAMDTSEPHGDSSTKKDPVASSSSTSGLSTEQKTSPDKSENEKTTDQGDPKTSASDENSQQRSQDAAGKNQSKDEKSAEGSAEKSNQSGEKKDDKYSSTEAKVSDGKTEDSTKDGEKSKDDKDGGKKDEKESKETSSIADVEKDSVRFGEMEVVEMKPPSEKYEEILEMCLQAFRLCATRFPQHHKSIYRMACMYYYCKKYKNRVHAQDMLLGSPNWMRREHMVCPGLFQERKPNNFFQGLWVNPIADVERAGSFACHLERSLRLLLRILVDLDDNKTLHNIHVSLSRTPDLGKTYLSDNNRVEVSKYALTLTLNVLRKKLPHIAKMDWEMRSKFILEVHRVWQSCKQTDFGKSAETLLTKTFTLCYKGKLSGTVLDQVNQFVQMQTAPKPLTTSGSETWPRGVPLATSSPGRSWSDVLTKPSDKTGEATKGATAAQGSSTGGDAARLKPTSSPGHVAKKMGRPPGSKNLLKPASPSTSKGVKRPAGETSTGSSKQAKTDGTASVEEHTATATAIAAYQGQVNAVFQHLLSSMSTAKDGATVMYLLNVASSMGLLGSTPQAAIAQQQLLAAMMMNPNATNQTVASVAAMMAAASGSGLGSAAPLGTLSGAMGKGKGGALAGKTAGGGVVAKGTSGSGSKQTTGVGASKVTSGGKTGTSTATKPSSGVSATQKASGGVSATQKASGGVSATQKSSGGVSATLKSSGGAAQMSKSSGGTSLGKIASIVPSGKVSSSGQGTTSKTSSGGQSAASSKPSTSGSKPSSAATKPSSTSATPATPGVKPNADMVQKWKASIKSSLQKVQMKPATTKPTMTKPTTTKPTPAKPTAATTSKPSTTVSSKAAAPTSSSMAPKKPTSQPPTGSHQHFQKPTTSNEAEAKQKSWMAMKNPPAVQRTVSNISDNIIRLVPESRAQPAKPSPSQQATSKPAPPKLTMGKPTPATPAQPSPDGDSSDCIVISTSDSE